MPIHQSFTQRTPLINTAFAGIACAATLLLTAGPALAQTAGMERVEINGRVVDATPRYDVRASCATMDTQLQSALQTTWVRERRVGEVKVRLVMEGGQVTAVSAQGISNGAERSVRRAVKDLQCSPPAELAAAGPQIYRFSVDFIDPEAPRADAASTPRAGYRVALLKD